MTVPREPSGERTEAPGRSSAGGGPPAESREGRAPELFGEALELGPEARAAYLDRACAGDPGMRAEVESLLAAHAAGAAAYFHRPLQITSSGNVLSELFGGLAAGARIGPYQVVQQVASGGMGAVYLAERTDGAFQMRVAIKLIHPVLWGTDALERFRLERQVLADLKHPGIARLIDGGSTAGDMPYLVMEYVDGMPIDRHCEDRRLDVRARLTLFLEVCGVVQYAHQNLVIHRDLKPGNIFVDGSGRVRLLDFGIAKVLGGDGAPEGGDLTATHHPLTPRYASPEQVLGHRMTTATDIYSLGVVLYQMLTGQFPYDLEQLPPAEIAYSISRREPIPPSRRSTDSRASRQLQGDLDTILLKALQKDPSRRYATVGDFAADLRRHLEGLPVKARPDTVAYRVAKFVTRHRTLVVGATAAVAIIVGALGVTLAAYRQATAAKREAEWQAYVASLAATESSIRSDQIEEAASHLEAAPARLRGWEWRHLRARVDRSLESFRAHEKGITRIVLLPDGERLLSASIDSTIKLWGGPSGQLVRAYGPFTSEVESVSPVRGTRLIAIGLNDGRVLLLDEADGTTTELQPKGPSWAFVSVSPDGSRLACGFFDGTVRVWSLPDGRLITGWKAHDGLALPAYSPDGRFLATGGGNGMVSLHDARSHAVIRAFRPHARRVYCMAFSPGGSMLVTGSMDQTVSVWNTERLETIHTFRDHRATPNAIAFDPSGETVLTAAGDGRLLRWNLATGKVLGEFRGHFNDVSSLAEHPDGSRVISADWNGFVKSWTWSTEDVRTLRVTTGWLVPAVFDVAWSPDRDRLVAASNVDLPSWTLSTGSSGVFVSGPTTRCVVFSPDGGDLVAGNDDGQLVLYRASDARPLRAVTAHRGRVLEMAFDPVRSMLATAAADSTVKLWRLPGIEPVLTLEGHRAAVEDVEFSPDGTLLASCGGDGAIRLWDPASGRATGILEAGAPVLDIAFDPGGGRLASASRGGGLRLWDVRAMRQVDSLGTRARVLSVAWSRDGMRVAAGGPDGNVRLYDVGSGHEVMNLHGHVSGVTSLQFSHGDSVLTSTSVDGTVRIWDAGHAVAPGATLPR